MRNWHAAILVSIIVVVAQLAHTAPSPTAPGGFVWYKTEKGDTLASICQNDPARQLLTMKINHFDQDNFPQREIILLPTDMAVAMQYVPVPPVIETTSGTREIIIYLDRQYFGAYENGRLVLWGPTSTGTKGRTTPTGKYQISYKERHKRSRKYKNAPMPFSLNLSGTGYFLHQQELPGYPASHGCIRLLKSDAEWLFSWSQVGDQVNIVR